MLTIYIGTINAKIINENGVYEYLNCVLNYNFLPEALQLQINSVLQGLLEDIQSLSKNTSSLFQARQILNRLIDSSYEKITSKEELENSPTGLEEGLPQTYLELFGENVINALVSHSIFWNKPQ